MAYDACSKDAIVLIKEREEMAVERDPAVNALAREGGHARALALTPEERREIAQKAARARWDRRDDTRELQGLVVSYYESNRITWTDTLLNVECNAQEEIDRKVRNHAIGARCPCDDCVDAVLADTRERYLSVLAKLDRGEKLDKGEDVLFKLLTGAKANRWTQVYRKACKDARQQL